MAPVQTAYTVDHAAALRGNIANANGRETTSGVAEVAIQPGFPVVRGTADNGVVLPDGTGDSFRGVSVRSLEQEKDSVTGTLDYNITDEVQILRKGEIWVLVNEPATRCSSSIQAAISASSGTTSIPTRPTQSTEPGSSTREPTRRS
jgi:hypothetical protein